MLASVREVVAFSHEAYAQSGRKHWVIEWPGQVSPKDVTSAKMTDGFLYVLHFLIEACSVSVLQLGKDRFNVSSVARAFFSFTQQECSVVEFKKADKSKHCILFRQVEAPVGTVLF